MIHEQTLRNATILVVDDQQANVTLLERMLDRAGYARVHGTTRSADVLDMVGALEPDILLLDLHMPQPDGFRILSRLQEGEVAPDLPVLVLTADSSPEVKRDAFESGASDLLTKPFDYSEVLLRLRNLLTTRFLQMDLRRQNEVLDEKVRERTRELESTRLDALERLARAAEFRDDDTGQHTRRVGNLSAGIAAALGLSRSRAELIRLAAPLHDIGKIGIPDAILLKPDRLTPEERRVMEGHTEIGAQLLTGGNSALMEVAEVIARHHHERWNGGGYPSGLAGEEIPLVARIVSVADVYDALSHDRPYREARPRKRVLERIRAESGEHFDPRVVDAFLGMQREASAAVRRPAPKGGRPPRARPTAVATGGS